MEIRERLMSIDPRGRSGDPLPLLNGIVIHWVANPGATPDQIYRYFESTTRYASAHYCIGIDGEILRLIPEDEVAWHAGPSSLTSLAVNQSLGGLPNWRTIGIELCHPDWTGKFTDKTLEAAISLTADIGHRNNVDVMKNLLRHYDCTGKHCPKWFVDHPEAWRDFRDDVSIAMAPRNVSRI